VAKVDDKKLPIGVKIEPSHVAGNLSSIASNFAGNFTEDQRQQGSAPFSVSWFISETNIPVTKFYFTLPPLQDHFNTDLVSDSNTPSLVLDSISLSFDQMNQGNVLDTSTGYPATTLTWQDLKLTLSKVTNNPQSSAVSGIDGTPQSNNLAEVFISGVDLSQMLNTKNPTILRDLSVNIDPYDIYQWKVEHLDTLFSVHIRASFSHPVVERDTQEVVGDYLNGGTDYPAQNAPINTLYGRDKDSLTIATPAANAVISAENAQYGVQTQLEQVDRKMLEGLEAGRFTTYNQSEVAATPYPKEALKEDSGYFCWNVNMLKHAAREIDGANVDGYQLAKSAAAPSTVPGKFLYDKALVPIPYPLTIHHVFLEMSGIDDIIRESPGAIALDKRYVEVGVGILHGVRAQQYDYLQVAHLETMLSGAGTTALLQERLFPVPIVYSTHGSAGPLGKGYVTQGRPYYAGRQYSFSSSGNRENVCSVDPTVAEAAPSLNGFDQYIEVRCIYGVDPGTAPEWPAGGANKVLGAGGINVYIIGKMQLQR
jgi:hypothetical protein|tara:strand:+ start:825 stop:2438 length:1614 start_codon:yes stop_codon:yes gene_type:complete